MTGATKHHHTSHQTPNPGQEPSHGDLAGHSLATNRRDGGHQLPPGPTSPPTTASDLTTSFSFFATLHAMFVCRLVCPNRPAATLELLTKNRLPMIFISWSVGAAAAAAARFVSR